MALFNRYDPLDTARLERADPNHKYFWAATDIRSPHYIGAMKAAGYHIVPDSEGEKLGFDMATLSDGGLRDKTNHRFTTGDLILVRINREVFVNLTNEKNREILRYVGKKTSEFDENAEKAGVLLRT